MDHRRLHVFVRMIMIESSPSLLFSFLVLDVSGLLLAPPHHRTAWRRRFVLQYGKPATGRRHIFCRGCRKKIEVFLPSSTVRTVQNWYSLAVHAWPSNAHIIRIEYNCTLIILWSDAPG